MATSDTGSAAWVPILDGALGEQAEAAIEDLTAALARCAGPETPGLGAALSSGHAGLALFWAYRHWAYRRGEDAERAVAHLDRAIEAVAGGAMVEGLFSGFTGIAWTAEHVGGRLLDDGDDLNEAIDAVLRESLARPSHNRPYDLIAGLVGLGVYAIERSGNGRDRGCLEAVVTRLEEQAQRRPGRATWFLSPQRLPPRHRDFAPNGYYNLGVAHGVPGVVGLLGATVAADVGTERTRPLLGDAVAWLLDQALPDDRESVLPAWLLDDTDPTDCRSAWCYGDPGAAAALLLAARATGNLEWESEAVRWIRKCAARPMHRAGVNDAGLCHGAAGLAHIFNRVYQATGVEELRDAARRWFQRALDMRRDDAVLGGFAAYIPGGEEAACWEDHPGLLTGAAGVGLALLAATTQVRPDWDRCLLTNVPPRGGSHA